MPTSSHSGSHGATTVLSVRDLAISFPAPDGRQIDVVSGVNFDVAAGEVLALVGESGCGKTVTALSMPALVPDPGQVRAGSILLAGRELVGLTDEEMSHVRGKEIGFVFQEPSASLNPAFTIGWQLRQPLQRHLGMTKAQARARSVELLGRVGIPNPAGRIDAYPHEFSGGMAQRVMIALALACEPKLVIADEPTTALDVTVQGQVLDLLMGLRDELGLAMLLITHDLGVVSDIADRAAVMYAGQVAEAGPVREVFEHPKHPYTAGLLASVPRNERRTGTRESIPGIVPPPWEWPRGCRFAARCGHATDACTAPVELVALTATHAVRCARAEELMLVGVEAP